MLHFFKGEGGLDKEFGSFKQRIIFSECINLVKSFLKVISG